jgi:glutaredoxin
VSVVKVEGENKEHKVFLYTLSTCGWCKKTKQLLKENDIEYEFLDVDLCSQEKRSQAVSDIRSRNIPLGFPIIIIDDEEVISGYKEGAIREALDI